MTITICEEWKEKQLKALKELYELHEKLSEAIILLNEPYVRKISSNMTDIQDKLTESYNSIMPIVAYLDGTPHEE